jgi:hypothetical protein
MRNNTFLTSIVVALMSLLPLSHAAADNGPVVVGNITINVVDPIPVLGFGDPTPAVPVGGNTGLTVGEQRLNAYVRAAEIWQAELGIDTQVVLQAIFFPLSCNADSGVLGAAGANTIFRDFPGPSFPSTWYAAALANELSGFDLGGTDPDPAFSAPPYNDEIISLFNSNLGNPGCLENSGWYYGLDNNNPAGTIDFLTVLMHEVGHGLGFQNFANGNTGANFLGFPDQWARFQRDNALFGKHWDQMIDIERQFSATNGPNLVWTGPAVTAEAPNVLGPAQGPSVPAGGLTADVELANDGVNTASDACEAVTNDLTGKIALVDRGSCTFVLKAQNAEAAGAIGVIIANNQSGASPIGLGGSGLVGIPTVSATLDGGALLRAYAGTNVTIGAAASDGSLSGADGNGLVKLYAPFPIQSGSSVSHFDVTATPNVLMEPSINSDLTPATDLDLTDELLNDIGWNGTVSCPVDSASGPTVNIFGCDTGVANRQGTYTVIPSKTWLPGQFGAVAGGCYIQDVVDACFPLLDAKGGGGHYQSCIAQVTSDLKQQRNLSKSEVGAIKSCATFVAPILNP